MLPFILGLGLVACDAAGPGFSGSEKVVRTIDGSRFSLRRQGDVVEAIRTSPEMLPRFQTTAAKAGRAAQIETGCTAAWVMGDPAMMWVGLSCDGRKAPKLPRRPRTLYCEFLNAGQAEFDMQCSKT